MKTIDIKKISRRKISTAITAISPDLGPIEDQISCICNWSNTIPKVLVAGATEPIENNGVRWMRTNIPNPPVRNVLSSYLTPGNEICILASPTVLIGGDQDGLMELIGREAMDLSWMSYCYAGGTQPELFILSKSVAAHIAVTMPQTFTFANGDWIKWVHDWGKKYMPRHRYFDATAFGIAIKAPKAAPEPVPVEIKAESPVLNAYDLPQEEKPVKAKGKAKKKIVEDIPF